jgi:carboxymethylenebutenolidase
MTQFFPGAQHGFSDRDRHDDPVNEAAFRLAWPQALSFIDAVTA